jgi:hypothetical protein
MKPVQRFLAAKLAVGQVPGIAGRPGWMALPASHPPIAALHAR